MRAAHARRGGQSADVDRSGGALFADPALDRDSKSLGAVPHRAARSCEGPFQRAATVLSALELPDNYGRCWSTDGGPGYHANMQGEKHLAAELARQALDRLPVSNDFSCSLRSVATSLLGDASWMDGNLAEAQRAYTDAVVISQAAGNSHTVIIASSNLADILMEQGQLQQAARFYSDTLRLATLPDGQIFSTNRRSLRRFEQGVL